jgi:hypothetical protein
MLMSRLASFLLLVFAVAGCSDQPSATVPGATRQADPSSTSAIDPGPADRDVIDVCGLMPRAPVVAALGELTGTVDNNRRSGSVQTEPGYGSCTFDGPKLATIRLDVSTAFSSSRAGLGSPRNYVENIWPIGQGAVESIGGLGSAARLSDTGRGSFVLVAAADDRYIQLITSGIPRSGLIELARAALVMPLTP